MKILKRKFGFWRRVTNAFYPERCPYCHKVIRLEATACDACLENFPDFAYVKPAIGGYVTVSAVPYLDNFSNAVKGFKFYSKTRYCPQLAFAIAQAVVKEFGNLHFDMITFVPLHPKRLEVRGYNQSELLANELSVLLGLPVVTTLIKTRNNEPQHTQKAADREKNVKGAYRVRDKQLIEYKQILLIDDIITTGHTLGECAKTLEKAGAGSVHCATFAVAVAKTT